MADDDIRQLAEQLNRETTAPGDATYLRRGVVTAFDRSTNSYTITIGGTSIVGVPALNSVYAMVNDPVDVLFDGPAPRILGVIGVANGLPDTNSYVTAYASNGVTVANGGVSGWQRVPMSFSDGNSALWSAANNWYTVPSNGLYAVNARVRLGDSQPASTNFALGVDVGDAPDESRTIWNSIPSSGSFRRVHSIFSMMQRFTAGQQLRATMFMDGAAIAIYARSLSIVKLGQ